MQASLEIYPIRCSRRRAWLTLQATRRLRPASLFSPLRDAIRRLGWVNAWLYSIAYALSRTFGDRVRLTKYDFVAQPVVAFPRVVPRASDAIRIWRITPDDPIVEQFPRPADVIARRFAQGAVCFVARAQQQFAGYIWLQRTPYDEDEVRCLYIPLPKSTSAWDFDVYVAPAFRMGRCFLKLWDAANAHLLEQGVEWTLSRIDAFNVRSFKAHARLGVRKLGGGVFLSIGNAQLAILSLSPFLHLSLDARSRPVLRLKSPAGNG